MSGPYDDIDPGDIDPDTGRPYANYSSPALDTSDHDREMDGDDPNDWDGCARVAQLASTAIEEVWSKSHGFVSVDWTDLGEVTIVTKRGTFRLTAERLNDQED